MNAPLPAPETAALRDGTPAIIRPICPEDAPRLQAFVLRLSERTAFLRFLGTIKGQSDAEARRLATVDYDRRMAFVAVCPTDEEYLLGVARYAAPLSAEPGAIEVAVVVEDGWQGRGLGSLLLARLLDYAAGRGFTTLLATVHTDNEPVLRFIRNSGLPYELKVVEPGAYEARIRLTGDPAAAVLGTHNHV